MASTNPQAAAISNQRWRRHKRQPLRLEAQLWSRPALCHPVPVGWISGNFDFFDYQRPIELLRKGVIDAWVASYPDIPDHDDVEIASIRLNRMPMHLLDSPSHPLLNLGDSITVPRWLAIRAWPYRRGAFPKFQAIATQCGYQATSSRVLSNS